MFLGVAIFGLGLVFFVSGGLSLLVAMAHSPVSMRKRSGTETETLFHILIPAHNEQSKIARTLDSLLHQKRGPEVRFKVSVGLDSCSDGTEKVVDQWSEKLKLLKVNLSYLNKWKALEHLVSLADPSTDWIVFVDAGTSLSLDFLQQLTKAAANPSIAVIAPAYRLVGGSQLQSIFWSYEKKLKNLENRLGGPISVHGAAVAYRKPVADGIFLRLKHERPFMNDDIIGPLAARIFFPRKSIYYFDSIYASDEAHFEKTDFKTGMTRRKRMMLGNIEWMRWMLKPAILLQVPIHVWIVALRRMLRPFWIWCFMILGLGLAGIYPRVALLTVILPCALFPAAALASLYAPIAFCFRLEQKKSIWR